ncbi:molecular chaperone [Desulfosarcina ovata subsp. sediminis]|uniref:Molecular chaperone n=1 Tax=Desulfosarcina ovata subsp. sediminis TaxID=885957 RepID=A0A5K7ZXL2_9BACT|nr:Hsp20/alpha crystallin family protein [Desulfosarcina ovata]BBO84989.1 molecular chaperone [Desulfosarcina ovata subsp. sediminis]
MADSKELQVKGKQEAASPAEQTRPGVVFRPDVDIFEDEQRITLLADMPGVAPGDVTIDINDNVLSISGEVKPFEEGNESDVLIEFEIGRYHRQFTLSEVIDQSRIEAKLENGVLRLTLPKAEKAIPRQITVTVG